MQISNENIIKILGCSKDILYLCVDKLRFDITCYYSMGQLAFLKMFLLVSIPAQG